MEVICFLECREVGGKVMYIQLPHLRQPGEKIGMKNFRFKPYMEVMCFLACREVGVKASCPTLNSQVKRWEKIIVFNLTHCKSCFSWSTGRESGGKATAGVTIRCRFLNACQKKSFCVERWIFVLCIQDDPSFKRHRFQGRTLLHSEDN